MDALLEIILPDDGDASQDCIQRGETLLAIHDK
jgi:hypothetical protein